MGGVYHVSLSVSIIYREMKWQEGLYSVTKDEPTLYALSIGIIIHKNEIIYIAVNRGAHHLHPRPVSGFSQLAFALA